MENGKQWETKGELIPIVRLVCLISQWKMENRQESNYREDLEKTCGPLKRIQVPMGY
jgi:hypothetical protein